MAGTRRVGLDLLPQPTHVGAQILHRARGLSTPEGTDELLLRHPHAAAPGEKVEELVLERGDVHL
jgi:hypothetical protein